MNIFSEDLLDIDRIIKENNRFLIIPHKAPDGDTLGSALGLHLVLTALQKSADILCFDAPPPEFSFLPAIEKIKTGKPDQAYDVYFILDAGAPHLTGFHESHPWLFNKTLEVINIDHHPSNNFYGRYNAVVPEAASTTMVLYEIITRLQYPLDRAIATCLLTGIYTDTGSFMHSNTTPEVLRIAARLLAKGANLRSISKEIFKTTKISTMRLWGRVLRNITQTPSGITLSVVRPSDFAASGADYSEMTGVVDFVNSVPGACYSVILTEKEGKVKGSLRTLRDEVNVSDIAAAYGGGGHTKAAGFTLPGRLEKEIRWKVVNESSNF